MIDKIKVDEIVQWDSQIVQKSTIRPINCSKNKLNNNKKLTFEANTKHTFSFNRKIVEQSYRKLKFCLVHMFKNWKLLFKNIYKNTN